MDVFKIASTTIAMVTPYYQIRNGIQINLALPMANHEFLIIKDLSKELSIHPLYYYYISDNQSMCMVEPYVYVAICMH